MNKSKKKLVFFYTGIILLVVSISGLFIYSSSDNEKDKKDNKELVKKVVNDEELTYEHQTSVTKEVLESDYVTSNIKSEIESLDSINVGDSTPNLLKKLGIKNEYIREVAKEKLYLTNSYAVEFDSTYRGQNVTVQLYTPSKEENQLKELRIIYNVKDLKKAQAILNSVNTEIDLKSIHLGNIEALNNDLKTAKKNKDKFGVESIEKSLKDVDENGITHSLVVVEPLKDTTRTVEFQVQLKDNDVLRFHERHTEFTNDFLNSIEEAKKEEAK